MVRTAAKQKPAIDFEAKAEEQKQRRVRACVEEVNAVLEKHRCDIRTEIQYGEQWIPVSTLLTLPNRVAIVSK